MDEIEISFDDINNENRDIEISDDNTNRSVEINNNEIVQVVTSDYEDLQNKPKINNVTLIGNKTLNSLGIPEFSYNSTTETLTITLV